MIYDANDADRNSNLGNFVAFRLFVPDLPEKIKSSLQQHYQINPELDGYIYVGFAHFDSVSVVPSFNLQLGSLIGMSGNSGLLNEGKHLDLSTFYIPNQSNGNAPDPNTIALISPGETSDTYFQSFYSLFFTQVFNSIMIDPLILWPALVNNTQWNLSILVSPITTPPSECYLPS